jgi:trigger factor
MNSLEDILKIEKLIQDDHQAKLIVEFEQEKMEAYKHRAARKLAERGKIPGFRPGKAPYDIIVRNYGEDVITEKAVDLLVDEEYSNILKEAEITPGASGTLEPIDTQQPTKFTFRVPLAPEVDLGKYHSVRLPYKWSTPTEKEVDQALEDLRQMYATTETVEREAQIGDYVLLDVKSETAILNRTGFATFILKEDRESEWPFRGFAKQLVGIKSGGINNITHKFPKDWDVEELQGKSVEIEATIKTVRSVTLPDLNDEFARMTGLGENLEGLMGAVKKDVETRSRADYEDQYFNELIEKIKVGATIKYAPQTLEHEGEHVLDDLSQRLAQQNMDLETYFKIRQTTREKFIKEDVEPVAKKRLERLLILNEIVRAENIQVENTKLNEEFNNTVSSLSSQGLDFNKIRGGKQGQQRVAEVLAMESANRLLTRRALDILKDIATDDYKPPQAEDVDQGRQTISQAEDIPGAEASSPSVEKKPSSENA